MYKDESYTVENIGKIKEQGTSKNIANSALFIFNETVPGQLLQNIDQTGKMPLVIINDEQGRKPKKPHQQKNMQFDFLMLRRKIQINQEEPKRFFEQCCLLPAFPLPQELGNQLLERKYPTILWLCFDLTDLSFRGQVEKSLGDIARFSDVKVLLVGINYNGSDRVSNNIEYLQKQAENKGYGFSIDTSTGLKILIRETSQFFFQEEDKAREAQKNDKGKQKVLEEAQNNPEQAPAAIKQGPLQKLLSFVVTALTGVGRFIWDHKLAIGLGLLLATGVVLLCMVPGFGQAVGFGIVSAALFKFALAAHVSMLSAELIWAIGCGIVAATAPFWGGQLLKEVAAALLKPLDKLLDTAFILIFSAVETKNTNVQWTAILGVPLLIITFVPWAAMLAAFLLGEKLVGTEKTVGVQVDKAQFNYFKEDDEPTFISNPYHREEFVQSETLAQQTDSNTVATNPTKSIITTEVNRFEQILVSANGDIDYEKNCYTDPELTTGGKVKYC